MTYKLTEQDKNAMALARIEFKDNYMKPAYYIGEDIEMQVINGGLDLEADGIYCRLTDNGFMDSTDLNGPYSNVVDAANALIEIYGVE